MISAAFRTIRSCFFFFVLSIGVMTAGAQATGGTTQQAPSAVQAPTAAVATESKGRVTISVDEDLVFVLKLLGGVVVFLFAVFVGAGIFFFGWDVTKTRNTLIDAREDIIKRMELIRSDHEAFKALRGQLHELGAELEGEIAKRKASQHQGEEQKAAATDVADGPEPDISDELTPNQRQRAHFKAIKDVLLNSKFQWSTIETIMRKTGLTRQQVIDAASSGNGTIGISVGRATNDLIFRYDMPHNELADMVDVINDHRESTRRDPDTGAFERAVWDAARQGKAPPSKGAPFG